MGGFLVIIGVIVFLISMLFYDSEQENKKIYYERYSPNKLGIIGLLLMAIGTVLGAIFGV